MKVSLNWISDYVDVSDVAPETIADRLTMATAEVEEVELLARALAGVVVAEVLSAKPLPAVSEAGVKLHLVEVDAGESRYVTVCGVPPNVRPGMKAPFAASGVTLAGGQKVETAEIAGEVSQGVLCSAAELGLSRWHEVLLECPASVAAGTKLQDVIPAKDVLIEIENKSLTHRPDLWGQYGFAREVAALFGRELRPLGVADLARYSSLPEYGLEVEDLEKCPCYGCIAFDVPSTVASPLIIQSRLHGLGQRTYNLLVDLTNYVMLELGQPTHAFDRKLMQSVRVAPMAKTSVFVTLDGKERTMEPDDLMIWNQERPVAIAGVMGGLDTEISDETTSVLLESANFKASRIRQTSMRLALRTDASQRFEKGQPPSNVKTAAARILHLIDEAGIEAQVQSRFTVQGDLKDQTRPIRLPPRYVTSKAGAEIPDTQQVAILRSLGFGADLREDGDLEVGVPPFRSELDVAIPEDVLEEVLRVYGYDNILPSVPAAPLRPVNVNQPLRREHQARRLLAAAHQFTEVQSYAWMDDRWLAAVGYDPPEALALQNPSAQGKQRLRTSLVPNLLGFVRQNCTHSDGFRLFELGRVFVPDVKGGCQETTGLAAVSYRQPTQRDVETHFRELRGVVEDLGIALGCGSFAYAPGNNGSTSWQCDQHWVAISHDGKEIGAMGALTGTVLETVAKEGEVVYFELDFDYLSGVAQRAVKSEPLMLFPGSWQDFSLLWNVADGYAALEDKLNGFSHSLVKKWEFLWVYSGRGLPAGQRSYSFRFWLNALDRTLSSEDIDDFRSAFLAFLESESIALR